MFGVDINDFWEPMVILGSQNMQTIKRKMIGRYVRHILFPDPSNVILRHTDNKQMCNEGGTFYSLTTSFIDNDKNGTFYS